MAEDILVGGVEEIVKRLISLGIDEIALLRGVKGEVQKLQMILSNIQVVLQDAEKEQVKNEKVRLWLENLKQAAFDAEDILDEFAYDGLRRKIVIKKVHSFFSCFSTLAVHSKTAHAIQDICKRLEFIDKQKNSFDLKITENVNAHDAIVLVNARDTSSLVDETDVVGRDTDKLKIVNMLIHGHDQQGSSSSSTASTTLSIIPIVGLGGLGKTTLAQLVFNDEKVKKHFSLMIWVCVSEDFVVTTLWSQILQEIDSHFRNVSSSKQALQNSLREKLSGTKFLLVLDDFWKKGVDKWDELILPLKMYGGAGSRVIVTTRDKAVAATVGAQNTYELQVLSDQDCFRLFESRAFMQGGPEKTHSLMKIAIEIVNKCGGIPLAAKVLGGLMHSKTTEREWSVVRDDELWKTTDEQKKIMEVLKLSYNELPPLIRQCFSYCSIFPKDYEFEREKLIQLWMAQGFLKVSRKGELMENLGDTYFNILHRISFFQNIKKNKFGDITTCKMHDLVHDLAQYLSQSECGVVVNANNEINEDLFTCRHLSLISGETILEIPKGIEKVKKLRTFSLFIPVTWDYYHYLSLLPTLFELRMLRVLDLSHLLIEELPSSIGGLKLLKFLDLSFTRIKQLPPSITDLYNLQTLNLTMCKDIFELPANVGSLSQLRHFYMPNISGVVSPRGLNQLHFLQTLPDFRLCIENAGAHIAELEFLNFLAGNLMISNLGHLKDVKAARKANLVRKKNLRTLRMNWGSQISSEQDIGNAFHDSQLLDALQPHPNLKELEIIFFSGTELPCWMTNSSALSGLVKLDLYSTKCTQVKSFKQLPSLKELNLAHMANMKRLGYDNIDHEEKDEVGVAATVSSRVIEAYPSLEKLSFEDMPNFEEWLDEEFPHLQVLELRDCPMLRKMPHLFPSLKSLVVNRCGEGVRSAINNLTSLTYLSISGSEDLPTLLSRKNMNLLESLQIIDSRGIKAMPYLSGLELLHELQVLRCEDLETMHLPHALKRLKITSCPKLEQLPLEFIQNNEVLRDVRICHCSKFRGFLASDKEQVLPAASSSSSSSSSLEVLVLEDCPGVVPSGLQLKDLTKLRGLCVCGCTKLKSLEGLQFLPNIEILTIGEFSNELDHFPFPVAAEMNNLVYSLRELHLHGWSNINSLPDQIQHLRALKSLSIIDFYDLTDLPDWLVRLASLENLVIRNCRNLKHMPPKQKLQHLRIFDISGCPFLEEDDKSRSAVWTLVKRSALMFTEGARYNL